MKKAEAYDERFEEVGWGHTICEGGEQGSASLCGVAGGKGLNQGESGLPKHVPNPVSGKRATGGGPDTESFCRQSPEVGAGWFNDHVRICAGGAQQFAFLPQQRGVRRNPYSYRNWEPRVGNCPRPSGQDKIVKCISINLLKYKLNKTHEGISEVPVLYGRTLVSACQKIDIYVNPKNKWRFKIAKNFHVR